MHIIKESWKKLWNAQEVRALVLTSLCLQFLLVFLAPFRKRTSQKFLMLLLWLSYLVADYVAILALGHILKKQSETGDDGSSHGTTDLMSFWAPFLLLHLGGPDTITSYSIEDNELWWRHLLGLGVQVSVAFLVLLELASVPTLRIAAAIVFLAGLIKYSERTWALRSASMNQLRSSMIRDPDPGPNYVKFMKEYVWRREAGQTTYVKRKDEPPPSPPEPSNNDAQIDEAHELFKRFKILVVDLMLTFEERIYGQTYFWRCSVTQAFEVVAIELSFLYDVLHTKAVHIRSLRGCLWRFVSLAMLLVSLLLFHRCEKEIYKNVKENHKDEKERYRVNLVISYVLLGSAVFMELASLAIMILSDWMIVALKKHELLSNLAIAITKFMSIIFPKGKPRWSNSMGRYSLLSFSLGDKNTIFRRILRSIKVEEFWDDFIFVESISVPENLKKILFNELKIKSERAQRTGNFKELRDCKGEKVLQDMGWTHLRWSINKEFDESILLWHIATDLCFHTDSNVSKNSGTDNVLLRHIRCLLNLCTKKLDIDYSDREISLITSNYMLYLLIMQPSLMPAGIGKIRFQDTCAEAKDFFQTEEKISTKEEATEALFDVETEVNPAEVKGDRSKSVLFDACRLAKELNLLEEDERWCLINKVWVEMLGYAAINCKTFYHAKQLSQGGELLTHVWLLMAHMGIGEQYRIEAGHAVATLAFNN